MSKLVSFLYNLARKANDVETILSGDPKRIARRLVNKQIAKHVAPHMYLKGGKRRGKRK